MSEGLVQYQVRDHDVVDYGLYDLPGIPWKLRGPRPKTLAAGKHVACIGAAQTFGTLVERPWPLIVGRTLARATLNLGVGGAGPAFFLITPRAIEYANGASAAVIQVMSARPVRNSYFEVDGGKNKLRPRGSNRPFVPGDTAFKAMLDARGPAFARDLVAEIRNNWVHEMELLFDAVRVPKILLWFSKRRPEYEESYGDVKSMLGLFPHLVNREMIERLRPRVRACVECVSTRGMPHRLVSRFSGGAASPMLGDEKRPSSLNTYYPSPEMHEDAAALLAPALAAVLR